MFQPYVHEEIAADFWSLVDAGRAGRAEDDDEVDPEEIAAEPYVHEEIAAEVKY